MTRYAILNELPPPCSGVIKEAHDFLWVRICRFGRFVLLSSKPLRFFNFGFGAAEASPAEDAALAEDVTTMLAIFLASRSALLATYLSCSLTCTNA